LLTNYLLICLIGTWSFCDKAAFLIELLIQFVGIVIFFGKKTSVKATPSISLILVYVVDHK